MADDNAGRYKTHKANIEHASECLPCFESATKMSTVDLSPTVGILRSLYKHVQILVDFADNIVFREGRKVILIEESDTSQFKSFVRGIFVCFDKELQQVPSYDPVNFQYLLITINNMHTITTITTTTTATTNNM